MTPLPIINSPADLAALTTGQRARYDAMQAGAKTVRLARLDAQGEVSETFYDLPERADGVSVIIAPPEEQPPPPEPEKPYFPDPVTGIKVALSQSDLSQFALDAAGYQSRILLGEVDLTFKVEMKDVDSKPHILSLRDYLALLSRVHAAMRAQLGFREGAAAR